MRDNRQPACQERCGADLLIRDIVDQVSAVEVEANRASCLTGSGEFTCAGPLWVLSVNGPGFVCRALWKTPEILHPDNPTIANGFVARTTTIITNVFPNE